VKHAAFTMIELTAVLLILAITVAAVAMRAQTPLRQANMREAVDAIADYGMVTRQAARQQGQTMWLSVDLSAGTFARIGARGQALGGAPLTLPTGMKVERVLVAGRLEVADAQQVSIPVGPAGLTNSYGLLLSSGPRRQWVIVAGLTGELTQVDSEQEARDILATAGNHAH
jgi:prepilin-type N-terminal cleavage/methylation domain-containing protein